MVKQKTKGAIIGAIIPLVLIWGSFFIAVQRGVPEIGFALAPVIIFSIPLAIIGFFVGATIIGKDKNFGPIIGLLTGVGYFLFKYIPYSQLPRIEQRGFSSEFIISIAISLVGVILGFVIGKLFTKGKPTKLKIPIVGKCPSGFKEKNAFECIRKKKTT